MKENLLAKNISFIKILANEDRLSIIQLLKEHGKLCAKDIGSKFFLEQSTTSHHLNLMKRLGLVDTVKQGRNIFYSLNHEKLKKSFLDFQNYLF